MLGNVGFYASGHDRKMTKKWDFRAGRRKSAALEERGQSGENSFGSAPGVADSRIDVKMLRDRHQGGKQKRTSPTPVNSALSMAGTKEAERKEPAFYPVTVVRIFSSGAAKYSATRANADEFMSRIAAQRTQTYLWRPVPVAAANPAWRAWGPPPAKEQSPRRLPSS